MSEHSSDIQQVLFERRVLMFVAVLTGMGAVTWLGAISTDYWTVVVANENKGLILNNTHIDFLWSHSGLWRRCDIYSALDRYKFGANEIPS